MRRFLLVLIFVAPVLFGQVAERQNQYSTAAFRLTEPSDKPPNEIALSYLASSTGVAPDDIRGVYLAKEYKTLHNGVTHLVYRQRFQDIEVYNGAWVANLGPDGSILNTGGVLYPEPNLIDFAAQLSGAAAVVSAVREVDPNASFVPVEAPLHRGPDAAAFGVTTGAAHQVQFAAGNLGGDVEGRLVWFAHRGALMLAWLFEIVDEDGVAVWDVAVEASTGAIIEKRLATFYLQAAPSGFVFDQGSPQPNPKPGIRLAAAPTVVERQFKPLAGDGIASPLGWILNNETAGYNAIVGEDLIGQLYLPTATRTRSVGGLFNFPVFLGPAAPNPVTFADAANVNLFYWVNRAHDLFYQYGFDEAAGNFQSDNYGRGGAAGDPMMAFTHYGAAAPGSSALNNAFFTTRSRNDGAASMIAMYVTTSGPGGFFSDGAYAADVIVHEYSHGVSIRLLPDGYGSFQTAAMGEGWSDFFGLEFTTPSGAPADGSYPTGEYWSQSWGTGIRTRPYSTDVKVNPLTFGNIGHVIFSPEIHADGEIWVEALWEARANLIEQFGETEGRRRIRELVIDGLKLSPPSPTMVDARDAILLADRVDFQGASQDRLWSAFAKRGLGALAYSDGGDTVHVVTSFEAPSPTARMKFYEDTFVAGEPIRVLLADSNLSQSSVAVRLKTNSGDVEDLSLHRYGSVYLGTIPSSSNNVAPQNGILNIGPGDHITATYFDADSPDFPWWLFGSRAIAVEATASTQLPYALVSAATSTAIPTLSNETRLTNVRAPVQTTLPFDFPFFSKKYRGLTVYPTGFIAFEPSVNTNLLNGGCNDTTELSHLAAIAPLFANLTFGTAQENEGIFISSNADTVALRWSAQTLPQTPSISTAIPEPVNFGLTLSADGVIAFYYGSGNQNLHTAAQSFSTCGAQPVVGISNGHDVYTRTITLRTYNNAPTVTFFPPFNGSSTPQVLLERPAVNETVRGVMRVSGIAYEPGLANLIFVSRRDVFVDDVQRTNAPAVTRTDYCATNPVPGCPTVGFQTDLDLGAMGLTPGKHSIRVRVTNTRGVFKDTDAVSFNVDATPARLPKGALESPASGAEVAGTVQFRGYAYADDLRVTRVDLLIDGVTYPGGIYGGARTDICGALPSPTPPNCPGIGWTATLNTRTGSPPLPDGPHSVQLRVTDETGRLTLVPNQPVPFTVKNATQTFPTGSLTSINPNARLSGVVSVSGYAYSPVGRVTSVALLVDEFIVAVAQYGLPRPQDCANLPGVTACPNIGFNVNLDTRTLTNGPHVLGVRIVNDSGFSVIVPNQVANGINVTVDNP
jgi:hypothetical protein